MKNLFSIESIQFFMTETFYKKTFAAWIYGTYFGPFAHVCTLLYSSVNILKSILPNCFAK